MARFARFLAAVLCFPLVWALCLTFVDSFFLVSGPSEGLFSAEAIALFSVPARITASVVKLIRLISTGSSWP